LLNPQITTSPDAIDMPFTSPLPGVPSLVPELLMQLALWNDHPDGKISDMLKVPVGSAKEVDPEPRTELLAGGFAPFVTAKLNIGEVPAGTILPLASAAVLFIRIVPP
jgi:hypothetical protein